MLNLRVKVIWVPYLGVALVPFILPFRSQKMSRLSTTGSPLPPSDFPLGCPAPLREGSLTFVFFCSHMLTSDPRPRGSVTVWFLNWAALVELNKCSSHDAEIETHSYDLWFSFLYLCMYLYICVGAHVCWCMHVLVCMQMCVHMCGGRGQAQVSSALLWGRVSHWSEVHGFSEVRTRALFVSASSGLGVLVLLPGLALYHMSSGDQIKSSCGRGKHLGACPVFMSSNSSCG